MIFGPDLNIPFHAALAAIPRAFIACALTLWLSARVLASPAVTLARGLLVTAIQWSAVVGLVVVGDAFRAASESYDLLAAIVVTAVLVLALAGPVLVDWRWLPGRLSLALGMVLLQHFIGLMVLTAGTFAAIKYLTRDWTMVR